MSPRAHAPTFAAARPPVAAIVEPPISSYPMQARKVTAIGLSPLLNVISSKQSDVERTQQNRRNQQSPVGWRRRVGGLLSQAGTYRDRGPRPFAGQMAGMIGLAR
ncbi:hypothetical protein GGTG_10468 [Gaeumannomyces tritici R3-111a-1]|uniref:Uncharacterized protein n=1 Tax=Gaeumannomyces tritici (strain R3-111a-1) TaxID=644352 RepID=J3PAE2_GAET3|nr:hypothetical protein GGTG_10468 [Gaeumannomyces tritici R3-111a-1]EJT71208.1 hypothetical protein GGTG_10468 [Gaeumannomyces tritici R3-111a-1]